MFSDITTMVSKISYMKAEELFGTKYILNKGVFRRFNNNIWVNLGFRYTNLISKQIK